MEGVIMFLLGQAFLLETMGEEFCYSHETHHYSYFATKTVYDHVRNPKGQIPPIPNCEVVSVWGLFRHGTRYPHPPDVKRQHDLLNLRDTILRNHKITPRSGELCWDDLELLQDWKYNVTANDADLLSSSGVAESYLLGKRLRTDFPTVLDATYTEDRFKIRFSPKIRTKQTADAFSRGLFGEEIDLPDEFVDGRLLEPNHNCSSWKASTKSEGAKMQTANLRNGPLMEELIKAVSERLGFRSNLAFDVISDIYDMCRFDKAWQPKVVNSPWCAAFTKDELKLLEFDEDLEYYYESGYGNPFSPMLGCPLVADLINTFHNRTVYNGSESGPSGVLYFSHSLTLRALLIRLGIARDEIPITSENYPHSEKRQWKTSFISPFAGNLVAVLYKCGEAFKVMFYLNEQYVDYDGCDVGLCNWTYIYDRFSPIVNPPATCNLDFCNVNGASSLSLLSALYLFTLLGILLK